jgi:hypothetical protein
MNIVIPIILTVINTVLCWVVWHRLGKQSVINDLMHYYDTACQLTEQQHRLIELLKRENAELTIENNELKKNKQ